VGHAPARLRGRLGPVAGGWTLYGRYARIESDGYREQSGSKLWSYAISAQRQVGDHVFRANLYGGPEETHLAYLGVAPEYLSGSVTGDAIATGATTRSRTKENVTTSSSRTTSSCTCGRRRAR
jgi:hypothetical protein